MAASDHGDAPYFGKPVSSVPVTPYITSVDANRPCSLSSSYCVPVFLEGPYFSLDCRLVVRWGGSVSWCRFVPYRVGGRNTWAEGWEWHSIARDTVHRRIAPESI